MKFLLLILALIQLATATDITLQKVADGQRISCGTWLQQFPGTARGCYDLVTQNPNCVNTYFSYADGNDNNCWCATSEGCPLETHDVVSTWNVIVPEFIDVAHTGTVTTSTVDWAHSNGDPNVLINGNTNNGNYNRDACIHTIKAGGQWAQLDLGESKFIDHVSIVGRRDCCHDQSNNLKVFVSDTSMTWSSSDACSLSFNAAGGTPQTLSCKKTGRYVLIRLDTWLVLCDLKAYTLASYSWKTGAWGLCSATCGENIIKSRDVTCERNDGNTANDADCTGTKPSTSEDCGLSACSFPCECTNGTPVAFDVAACASTGVQKCSVCHAGYQLNNEACEKLTCDDNAVVAISESCFCAGHTDPCMENKWCYDAVCHDSAKFPACNENAYHAQKNTCVCGTGTSATQCLAAKFCAGAVTTDDAPCQLRDDIEKRAFYGAHLDGSWDSTNREMTITLPISSDITVSSITWNEATDKQALRYLPSNVQPWTVDSTDMCQNVYALTVSQASFFGDGSHFVLNGTHMKTTLRVESTETMHQKVGAHEYEYETRITDNVPLLVELVKRMTIRATFRTTVPPPAKKYIKLDRLASTLTDDDKDELLAQCNSVYGQSGKIRCERIVVDDDGKVKIEVDTMGDGTKADLDDLLDDVEENGFVTPGFNERTITEKAHEEFVFLLAAENNLEISGMKTISLTMEIHSRTCVNHTLADTGVRLAADASTYIDESVADTTFVWKKNGDVIEQKHEYGLCVEVLTWTFAPKGYVAGTYEIELEFTLAGDDMGTFTTEAEIDLVSADVIADIGFTHTIGLYTGPECTEAQKTESVHIGDKFYLKISLGDMVVDAETITCESMTLTQTRGSESKQLNLKDDEFHFYQSETKSNSVVCGAELEAPLFASVTGFHTSIDIEIVVDYKLGSGGDSGNTVATAAPVNQVSESFELDRRVLRARLSTNEAPARKYREPEQDSLSLDIELLPEREIAVGTGSNLLSLNSDMLVHGGLFIAGTAFGYIFYSLMYKKATTEYTPLLEF